MDDYIRFRGLLCPGLYFSSGNCVSLLSWDSAPVGPPSYSQVWLTGSDGRSACYIPQNAITAFRFYHNFDVVAAATVDVAWKSQQDLSVRVRAEGLSFDLQIRIGAPAFVRIVNALLKTPAKTLLSSRGNTDAGRRYLHQPHRLAAVEAAEATLNGVSLGSLAPPPSSLRVGGARAPSRPMLSFCTHYLEPYAASAQPAAV
jgi:hypothetical protein